MSKSTVRAVLDRPHRHRNEDKVPGATIDVTEAQMQWLERDGIAHRAKASTTTSSEDVSDEETAG